MGNHRNPPAGPFGAHVGGRAQGTPTAVGFQSQDKTGMDDSFPCIYT